jgi:DNA-binding NtrC family response regulator
MVRSPEVMVLDDEPMVGKRLSLTLGKMGCVVEVFDDPHAALARIDVKEFHIVVTDVVMEDVDGLQVLERVQSRWPASKVIIMTAYAMMALARRAMDKGAFDFVAKPFEPAEMRSVVARAARELGFELPSSDASG